VIYVRKNSKRVAEHCKNIMKISVIIPVYNSALLVERTIQSVLNQIGSFELEIIAIDDCSTDNSCNLISAINDDRITLKKQNVNQGPAAARNIGIKLATGKYLALLDADDYWEPVFLTKTVSFLEHNSEAIAVSVGQIHKIIGKLDTISPAIINENKIITPVLLDDFFDFWAEHNHVCTGSVLMRTDIVKQTGGQREDLRICEDLEFWALLATYGKWGFIPEVLFVSDGGIVTKKQGWMEKNRQRWASAPTVEKWQERIVKRFSTEFPKGFQRARGRIAKNLAYSMIMSERSHLARETVKVFGKQFPATDKVAKLMNRYFDYKLTWWLLTLLIRCREYFR
jgi:glycosyltransferase involved in cell wall biosynthesis